MPELIWEGKYDGNGQLAAPSRVSLPFQTVETVNQSAQERQMALMANRGGAAGEWRNRLIWGDKKYVLPSLLDEFAGKVDLIYIDPPFATGADFSYKTKIHTGETASGSLDLEYQPNLIEQIAYRDTWGGGLDTYLNWMYDTLVLLRELLAKAGSIYVHCDWRTIHYIKAQMDNIFGYQNFRREIIWDIQVLSGYKTQANNYIRGHDTILYYTKSPEFIFDPQRQPHRKEYLDRFDKTDEDGRMYFDGRGSRRYLDDVVAAGKAVGDVWYDIMSFQQTPTSKEKLDYPTQKPEALLERIVKASSNEGDLVLDCFVGSGTTSAVAEKLGRHWIAADMGRFAISTTRKRLLSIESVRPFYVQNMGRYERQAWQSADLESNYREFILKLYHAEPVRGYEWLHGAKSGRMVHVGEVDAPVALDDVQRVAEEFSSVIGTGAEAPTVKGVDILGWDFGLEVDSDAREIARNAGISIRLLRIPREVMDQKAVAAGDVHFFELASLSVKQSVNGRELTLTLEDFSLPLDGVPDSVRSKVTDWAQWIDYWAVDWDYRNDTFNNQWQSYRTRQNPMIIKAARHIYDALDDTPGPRVIVIKVIDILGNDTTRRLEVTI